MFKAQWIFFVSILALSLAVNAEGAGPRNIARGKTVFAKGLFFTEGWGEGLTTDFSSVTDGVFFQDWQQWDQGAVWWDEVGVPDNKDASLTVYLGPKPCKIGQIRVQVDNNDDYIVTWKDEILGDRQVKVIPERYTGLAPAVTIPLTAITNSFTIAHDPNGAGDGWYSVSEFQALGTCQY